MRGDVHLGEDVHEEHFFTYSEKEVQGDAARILRCAECDSVSRALKLDVDDDGSALLYCEPCWIDFYGEKFDGSMSQPPPPPPPLRSPLPPAQESDHGGSGSGSAAAPGSSDEHPQYPEVPFAGNHSSREYSMDQFPVNPNVIAPSLTPRNSEVAYDNTAVRLAMSQIRMAGVSRVGTTPTNSIRMAAPVVAPPQPPPPPAHAPSAQGLHG